MVNALDGLIDNRNFFLLKELEKVYSIRVELVNDTNEYRCFSTTNQAIIYVPQLDICTDSFTHELLHLYLKVKKISTVAELKSQIIGLEVLPKIYPIRLMEHIGNCLDHLMILPIYLELGFDKCKFLSDYHVNKCTEQEIAKIKKGWKHRFLHNSKMIDLYIGKYFAVKACPNLDFNYSISLNKLRKIDNNLFSINEKLIDNWLELDINLQNVGDNCDTLIRNYIGNMRNWVQSKRIS